MREAERIFDCTGGTKRKGTGNDCNPGMFLRKQSKYAHCLLLPPNYTSSSNSHMLVCHPLNKHYLFRLWSFEARAFVLQLKTSPDPRIPSADTERITLSLDSSSSFRAIVCCFLLGFVTYLAWFVYSTLPVWAAVLFINAVQSAPDCDIGIGYRNCWSVTSRRIALFADCRYQKLMMLTVHTASLPTIINPIHIT